MRTPVNWDHGGEGLKETFSRRLPQARKATHYAARVHAGQTRGDGTPFILHALEVGSLLRDAGAPDHVIAAGVMHDVIEKTPVTASELQASFGPRITALVLAVTDDERITGYAKRKAALRRQVAGAGDEALSLFAADKLSKLRELRRETATERNPGSTARARSALRSRRVNHYRRSLALLQERLPDSPLVRELDDELSALLRDRPALARTR